jgi:hypothetical protein
MLLNPISFELPVWKEISIFERAEQLEWFHRLFGNNGDGAFLFSPTSLSHRPTVLFQAN